MKLEEIAADDDRMAGVVPSLIPNDHQHPRRRKSVIFPFPSSPHWEPTIATLGITSALPSFVLAHTSRDKS